MYTNFRQGIITYSISKNDQTFLAFNIQPYVSLQSTINDRVDITFAHGTANYLVTENLPKENAWGPFLPSTSYWLYWDIDVHTAIRTFGSTKIQPVFGPTAPSNPAVTQHWFDTTNNKMYVYETNPGWREVIRVFAARIYDTDIYPMGSDVNRPYAGSQVGLSGDTISGRIIFDEAGSPIILSGKFLTTEDSLYVNNTIIDDIRLESNTISAHARENIAKFQVVKFTNFGIINIASYNDLQENLIGLSLSDMLLNDEGKVCLSGIITNPAWNFKKVGALLWASDTGLLVETDNHLLDPANHPAYKLPIGQVLTSNSILFTQGLGDIGANGPIHPPIPLATDTVQGIAKLSVPAVDPSNPIMVETNDPRLIPYVHPATHPSTMITTTPYKFLTGSTVATELQQLADRTLDSLSDVSLSSPSAGNALVWTGTNWSAGVFITSQALANLLDVQLTTPVANQELVYNGTKWINSTPSINLVGDLTGSGSSSITTTLATVNSTTGVFGDSTHVAQFTVNAKGLITQVVSVPISFPSSTGIMSIDMSGGTTGLTYTGGPVTTTGVLTLSGTLNITNGGTSATIANTAFNNLAPTQTSSPGDFLTTDGYNTSWFNVYATPVQNDLLWGYNYTTGVAVPTTSPVHVSSYSDWTELSGGNSHVLGIRTNGTLWGWWGNGSGQLGLGDTVSRSSPVQIGIGTNWKKVACSYTHSFAVKTDGTLWAWGSNTNGSLGLGDTLSRSSPVQVGALTNWKEVSCAWDRTFALKTDGTLWAWGDNTNGVLGLGDTINRSSPVQVGALTDWWQISAGNLATGAVKTDGTLWMWGFGTDGRLGDGNFVSRSSPIQIGSLTNWAEVHNINSSGTAAIKTDGTLWTWGDNTFGMLANGSSTPVIYSSPVQVGSLSDWKHLGGGEHTTIALKIDGTLWGWGSNLNGQLATGQYNVSTYVTSPIQIGSLTNWIYVANTATGDISMGIHFDPPAFVYPLTNGGTGQSLTYYAINALLPSQTGQAGNVLSTDGANLVWVPLTSILP